MKISIITITYNSAKTLPRTLESVQSQTYPEIEHVIVDGASTDGTPSLIENYAKLHQNVRWLSEKDKGIYNALNKGISMATGDVIGFLHSDDVLFSTRSIEQIAAAFEKPDIDVVYGDLQYCREGKIVRRWKSNTFHPYSLKYGWMPPHPTVYVRKEVYAQVGEYDEWFRISADYDMMLRIFGAGYKTAYLPEVLVNMEMGGASNKNTKARLSKTQEDYIVLKKNHVGAGYLTVACKQLRKLRQFLRKLFGFRHHFDHADRRIGRPGLLFLPGGQDLPLGVFVSPGQEKGKPGCFPAGKQVVLFRRGQKGRVLPRAGLFTSPAEVQQVPECRFIRVHG